MSTVHVLTNKAQTERRRLADAVAIVIDVLFATTCIAIAVERGISEIVPTLDPETARECARDLVPGAFLLAGEQGGRPIPGFFEPWPHRLLQEDLSGKRLVYSTTNGTVALRMAAGAAAVFAGSVANGKAVVDYVCTNYRDRDIVLICAGVGTSFALEDFYGAGYLVSLLVARGEFHLTDVARAAQLLHDRSAAMECIADTYTGRMLTAQGLADDLTICASKNSVDAVPMYRDGWITRA